MAIFDIFKKRKKAKKREKPKKIEKLKEKEAAKEKAEEKVALRPPVSAPPRPRKKVTGVAPFVLKSAQVTEKATDLTGNNQYVFRVFPDSSKEEIKKAVEETYGVDILEVRTIKVPKKRRRLGRSLGWRKGYKKAIVSLKEGQKIEILPR